MIKGEFYSSTFCFGDGIKTLSNSRIISIDVVNFVFADLKILFVGFWYQETGKLERQQFSQAVQVT